MGICSDCTAPPSDAIWSIPRQHGNAGLLFRQPIPRLVLETILRLLTNPIVLRMALVFIAGAFAFVIGVIVMRRMRRNISEEIIDSSEPLSVDTLPLHTYHAVIQQLKQQKHELQSSQQAERRRARTSENISAPVLSHLSSGVMFIDSNGLVRQGDR